MAALPTNDQILDRYFQSVDDDSDFAGFSEVGSDVDIPNALNSSEDEQADDDSESENDDEIWTDPILRCGSSQLHRTYRTSVSRWF